LRGGGRRICGNGGDYNEFLVFQRKLHRSEEPTISWNNGMRMNIEFLDIGERGQWRAFLSPIGEGNDINAEFIAPFKSF
jgi:hypothetical protein